MNLSILFWFYKDAAACESRLRHYRRVNPGTSIFGLYSGELHEAGEFERRLGPLLDDFYVFDQPRTDYWRWANGDLVIAEWHRRRGRALAWDTVLVAAWDLLVLSPVSRAFEGLRDGEILLTNVRPVAEVHQWWVWVSKHRRTYDAFMREIVRRHGEVTPYCCQFVIVALPRVFLDRFSADDPPEDGFVEYRVPTYAALLGVPFADSSRFDTPWPGEPGRPGNPRNALILNPGIQEVPLRVILAERLRPGGARVFHPVERTYPGRPSEFGAWAIDAATGRRGRRPHKEKPRPHMENEPED